MEGDFKQKQGPRHFCKDMNERFRVDPEHNTLSTTGAESSGSRPSSY